MSAKLRVLVAALLFVSWIGYLAYLVATTRDTIVLSRPQFLVSNLYVIGKVTGDAEHPVGSLQVEEVPWSADDKDREQLVGATIPVKRLEQCQKANGWKGAGSYILPLMKFGEGNYWLTETPPSPGFQGREEYRLRIYPVTEQTRRQLQHLIADK
jgi:hypothetical protein